MLIMLRGVVDSVQDVRSRLRVGVKQDGGKRVSGLKVWWSINHMKMVESRVNRWTYLGLSNLAISNAPGLNEEITRVGAYN